MPVARLAWDHPTIIKRFWSKVAQCPGCDCLLYGGSLTNGWARLRANGFPGCNSDRVLAHRYAYALAFGAVPDGHDVHHSHEGCNHRNCVNERHLGTIDHAVHGGLSREFQHSDPWADTDGIFEPVL